MLVQVVLILGSSSGFLMGLVLAGGSPLPHPPLPAVLYLLGMVAHNYRPLHQTNWHKTEGWNYGLYSGGSGKLYCLP